MTRSIRTGFIFEHASVRGVHAQLTDLWKEIRQQKKYPAPVEKLLGESLVAAALLATRLKFDGKLTLQIQGKGALSLLVVEVTSALTCRATAQWDDDLLAQLKEPDLGSLTGESAQCIITFRPENGEIWQGIVEICGNTIADMLTNYMQQSEQLATCFHLTCTDDTIAGLMLQKLPHDPKLAFDHEKWNRLTLLAETVTPQELVTLPANNLLYRLFHDESVRVFEPEILQFNCACSAEKVSDMLVMLGTQEVSDMLQEQPHADITCDFCQHTYHFTSEEVQALFESKDLPLTLSANPIERTLH